MFEKTMNVFVVLLIFFIMGSQVVAQKRVAQQSKEELNTSTCIEPSQEPGRTINSSASENQEQKHQGDVYT